MTAARTRARLRALEILFEADVRQADPLVVLRERVARAEPDGPLNSYVATLVEGVVAHQTRIDELLATYSVGWGLDRMPVVDRNVLRIGSYELLWQDDVPDTVVLAEAVALARDMSTDDSPQFINGLLARLMDLKPTLAR